MLQVVAVLLLVAACDVDTGALVPGGGRPWGEEQLAAHLDELNEKVSFLDDCREGDVVRRGPSGWICESERRCPPGFRAVDEGTFKVCTRDWMGVTDAMVKAGDFWIDCYEIRRARGAASVRAARTTPPTARLDFRRRAAREYLLVPGQLDVRRGGQAPVQQHRMAGGSAGHTDPATVLDGSGGRCVLKTSAGARNTGEGTLCRSRFGAEDMIGNLFEWTADWHANAGVRWIGSPGPLSQQPWPPGRGYGDDADETVNVGGRTANDTGGYADGAPGAVLRGGYWDDGVWGGAFALFGGDCPCNPSGSVGARCCIGP